MPLDFIRNSSDIEREDDPAPLERLRQLERLLKEYGPAQPPDISGDPGRASARDALVSPRVRPFTETIADRLGTETWDVADALAARLLLDELTASLRGCRVVTNAVATQLRDTHQRLREGRVKLDREVARQSKHDDAHPSDAQIAMNEGSTD